MNTADFIDKSPGIVSKPIIEQKALVADRISDLRQA